MFQKPAGSELFKDDKGKWLKRMLFWETAGTEGREQYDVLYTLKEEDFTDPDTGKFYKSARKMYIEIQDPTEYDFAMQLLGSWSHWKALCKVSWFKEHLNEWREELEIKLRSKAIKAMVSTAIHEGSKGTTAAKYVASKGWEDNRGRPSKASVDKQARIQNRIHDEVDEDIERMLKH